MNLKNFINYFTGSNLNTKQAIAEFKPEESYDEVQLLLDFIQQDTSRGISKKNVENPVLNEYI